MIKATVLAIFSLILAIAPSAAFADMELSPLRQVISLETPVGSFVVSNPSDRLLEGRVTWIDLAATETGYAPASTEARPALSAAPYLTVSPAFFRIEPGKRVTVTVALKDGVRIPRGERRSHLLIETAASRTPIRKASNSGLQVDVGLGMSAPVLLRSDGSAGADITAAKLLRDKDSMLSLQVRLSPSGDHSAYGRLVADFVKDGARETTILNVRSNVASYIDAPIRIVDLPLGVSELGAGKLTLRYVGEGEYSGRLFDEMTYTIAPPE